MEAVLSIAVFIAACFLIDLLVLGVLFQLKKGRFEASRDDSSYFFFQTDLARVTINRSRMLVKVTSAEQSREIPFELIDRLDFQLRSEWAILQEWFRGLDLWDLFGKYRDAMNWHTISLVLAGGERVPLFMVGQYEPREPLARWWFNLQIRALHHLGWFRDGEQVATEVLERIQSEFRESGKDLRLVNVPRAVDRTPGVA